MRAALVSVLSEITANRTEIELAALQNLRRYDVLLNFLDTSPDEMREEPPAILAFVVQSTTRPFSYDGGGGALSSLLSSGDFALIEDTGIRRRLLEWQRLPMEFAGDLAGGIEIASEVRQALNGYGVYQARQRLLDVPGTDSSVRSLTEAMIDVRNDEAATDRILVLAASTRSYALEMQSYLPLADSLIVDLERASR